MRPSDLLWAGFAGQDAEAVGWLPEGPGGVILFTRNLDPDPARGPARCKALLDGLQSRWGSDLPLAVAIDQEGGAVSRLRPWVGETPSFRAIWEAGGPAACEAWGRLWGEGLAMLGFTVDFAPVADLWDGAPSAKASGTRSPSGSAGLDVLRDRGVVGGAVRITLAPSRTTGRTRGARCSPWVRRGPGSRPSGRASGRRPCR